MRRAISEAQAAAERGEVPVGAVIVKENKLIAKGGNNPIAASDPTAHAEITAIREACAVEGNYRLPHTTLYVTLEPCIMCMGAMIHARIQRVVFGAEDPKTGAAVSLFQLGGDIRLNHQLMVEGGLMAEECGGLLRDFFRLRRTIKRNYQGA